jgi:hypothetical protein
MTPITDSSFTPARAAELALVVESEACWDNLRLARSRTPGVQSTTPELNAIQKAYERFRQQMSAYNNHHNPPHVPEALLNNPIRLGTWCRRMRDLYLLVGQNPAVACPVHLLAKAYWWADKVAARAGRDPIARTTAPSDTAAVLASLESLGLWCEGLAQGTAA